jgi:hypothetical protein
MFKINKLKWFFSLKRDSIFNLIISKGGGKSDNGNQLYLHYKYDSSSLSFSNLIIAALKFQDVSLAPLL